MVASFMLGISAKGYDDKIYIYVSTNGNDLDDGNINNPLKTLEGARNKIRSLKKENFNAKKSVVVYIREGIYRFENNLILEAQDSGTRENPVVYCAYPGEKVMFTGSVSIPNNAFSKVDDEKILSRIITPEARDKIYSANFEELGFEDIGNILWPGAYSYSVNNYDANWIAKPDAPTPELYLDGKLQTIARYPNEGYMTVSEILDSGASPSKWDKNNPTEENDKNDTFEIRCDDKRYLNWTNLPENEALMYGFWAYAWGDVTVPLKKVYLSEEKIESGIPSWHGVYSNPAFVPKFFVFNLLEEIDTAGEFFYDKKTGELYIYSSKEMGQTNVEISLIKGDLIQLNGASWVTFRGIDMSKMRGGAVSITNGSNNRIEYCEISYSADRAVKILGKNSRCNVVDSCYIHDVNGGIGVEGGNIPNLVSAENVVKNCNIENFSRITQNYNAAVQISGVGNTVINNEMHGGNHLAIIFTGNNHKIYYNDIHDVLTNTDDMGAIYAGRSWNMRGTDIKYNYIHDLRTKSTNLGVFGVYMDDRLCGVNVEGNLFADIDGAAIFLNGGRDNVVKNNVAINCKMALKLRDLISGTTEGDATLPVLMESLESIKYYNTKIWYTSYSNLEGMLEDSPSFPKYNIVKNNLSVECGGKSQVGTEFRKYAICLEEPYEASADVFYDKENKNYRIIENSEVFENIPEFKQLPLENMGIYTSVGTNVAFEDTFENQTTLENWEAGNDGNANSKYGIGLFDANEGKVLRLNPWGEDGIGGTNRPSAVLKANVLNIPFQNRGNRKIFIKTSLSVVFGADEGTIYAMRLANTENDDTYKLFDFRETNGTPYFSYFDASGTIKQHEEFHPESNVWYDVEVVINPDNSVNYTVKKGNETKVSVVGGLQSDIASSLSAITNPCFDISKPSTTPTETKTTMYIDNVELYLGDEMALPTNFSDNFTKDTPENLPTHWEYPREDATTCSVKVKKDGENNYLRLYSYGTLPTENAPVVAMKDGQFNLPVDAVRNEKIYIEASIRIPAFNSATRYTMRLQESNGIDDYELFDFRRQNYNDGNGYVTKFCYSTSVGEYSIIPLSNFTPQPGVWYDVQVVINPDNTIDYSIKQDGNVVAKVRGGLNKTLSTIESINQLHFNIISSEGGSEMHIDNVSAYMGEELTDSLATTSVLTNPLTGDVVGEFANGEFNVKLNYNNTGAEKEVFATAALYEINEQGNIVLKNVVLSADGEIDSYSENSISIGTLTVTDAQKQFIKVFVWNRTDGITNLQPFMVKN